jgi:hypothetical protein
MTLAEPYLLTQPKRWGEFRTPAVHSEALAQCCPVIHDTERLLRA